MDAGMEEQEKTEDKRIREDSRDDTKEEEEIIWVENVKKEGKMARQKERNKDKWGDEEMRLEGCWGGGR